MLNWFRKSKKEEKKRVTLYQLNVRLDDNSAEIFTSTVPDAYDTFFKWFDKGKSPRFVMSVKNGRVCLNRASIKSYKYFSYETEEK